MKEIKLSNSEKVALCDDWWYDRLIAWGSWNVTEEGYVVTNNSTRMHHVVMEHVPDDGGIIDHKDRNTLNNQEHNLRKCTHQQNHGNMPKYKNNTSGYKGVSFDVWSNKYQAYIKKDGRKKSLGRFKDPVEAAKAYDKAAKEVFGEFAMLNFPEP